jgi:hypothetical protein
MKKKMNRRQQEMVGMSSVPGWRYCGMMAMHKTKGRVELWMMFLPLVWFR